MYFEFSGRGGAWRRSCCGWQGVVEMKGFIVFAVVVVCAVVVVACAVAVWFAATHSEKCIKYAERDELLYMVPVGRVMAPVYGKPCLVYESEAQK